MRARAERQAETKRRIAAATAELHARVGPARTTVAEIARRAGVQRLTVYNNFPEERDLLVACQGHFLAEHPLPELDPRAPLHEVLESLYGWYRETEPMTGGIARDRAAMPELDRLMADGADVQLAALADALAAGIGARGRRAGRIRAAVALALDFWAWRRLTREGLDDEGAAALMADAVAAAAARIR